MTAAVETTRRTIADMVAEGMDEATIVAELIDGMDRAELEDLARPLIFDRVRRSMRDRVRRIEHVVFGPIKPANVRAGKSGRIRPAADGAATRPAQMAALLRETFVVDESGRRVTWGEATGADHLARAEYLRRNATASLRTAARHEEAARIIAEDGVTCLAESARAHKFAEAA